MDDNVFDKLYQAWDVRVPIGRLIKLDSLPAYRKNTQNADLFAQQMPSNNILI